LFLWFIGCEEDSTKAPRMQHLKIRHKRCIEVQYSRTKEAQRNNEEIHEVDSHPALWWRTRQWTVPVRCAPDCPVGHQIVCAEGPITRRPWAVAPDCPVSTGQSGNGRSNDRLTWLGHRTVRCACRQKYQLSVQRLELRGEGYKYPQPAIWRCGSPNNIPRHIVDISKCSNTQVLNRITWWLA
jgi:hypothetical protein